jgi:PAS domain S-box-containing protein
MQTTPLLPDNGLTLQNHFAHKPTSNAEDEVYNGLLEIAAQLCGCPTAFISLVDKDKQWFKSKLNIPYAQLYREASFCSHAFAQQGVFMIADTHKDQRFYGNPLVTGSFNLRFYAGAPIVSKNGFYLGAICVIDHQPNSITNCQQQMLQKLAAHIASLMAINQQQLPGKLQTTPTLTRRHIDKNNFNPLFAQSSFPKIIFSPAGCVLDANEAALKLYGYQHTEMIGLSALHLKVNKSKEQLQKRVKLVEEGPGPITLKSKHHRKDGKAFSVQLTLSPIYFNGQPARLADIKDVSDKRALAEKLKNEKEIHGKKIQNAVIKIKQQERDNIAAALRENINQILACTNLYLGIAQTNQNMQAELVEKSRQNITLAIEEVKKLYQETTVSCEQKYLQNAIEQIALKCELLYPIQVQYSLLGDETIIEANKRLAVYRIIDEYLLVITKSSSIKKVWISVNINEAIQVVIRNNGQLPDNNKKRCQFSALKQITNQLNGKADFFEPAATGSTLQVLIPV